MRPSESVRADAQRRANWPLVFVRVFDVHVLAITVLTVLATWLSIRWGVRADLPSELIAVAVVFPIVFSINAAYKRREDALRSLAAVRAFVGTFWMAHRDAVPNGATEHAPRAAEIGRGLYASLSRALQRPRADRTAAFAEVKVFCSQASQSLERLRATGLQATEVGSLTAALNRAMVEIEVLRALIDYRTPASLRAHSKIFLNLLPILYAPLYAHVAFEAGDAYGYAVGIAFAVVLVGLDNIQDGLEHPFDDRGGDDVRLGGEADLLLPPAGEGGPS